MRPEPVPPSFQDAGTVVLVSAHCAQCILAETSVKHVAWITYAAPCRISASNRAKCLRRPVRTPAQHRTKALENPTEKCLRITQANTHPQRRAMDAFAWAETMAENLKAEFGERLAFVGLQGSRARGEAHDQSDIDLVVLLDSLCANDLDRYRAIVQNAPQSNLAGAPFRQNRRIPAHEIGAFSRTGRQRGPHPGRKQKLKNPSPQKQSRAGRARESSLELA